MGAWAFVPQSRVPARLRETGWAGEQPEGATGQGGTLTLLESGHFASACASSMFQPQDGNKSRAPQSPFSGERASSQKGQPFLVGYTPPEVLAGAAVHPEAEKDSVFSEGGLEPERQALRV